MSDNNSNTSSHYHCPTVKNIELKIRKYNTLKSHFKPTCNENICVYYYTNIVAEQWNVEHMSREAVGILSGRWMLIVKMQYDPSLVH